MWLASAPTKNCCKLVQYTTTLRRHNLYNGLLDEGGYAMITFNHQVNAVETVDLKEATKEALVVEKNVVTLEKIGHAKFVTLYVE